MSLYIITESEVIEPVVLEGVTFTTERTGVCGKLTFDILYDGINIPEGSVVQFTWDDYNLFQGYLFKKSMSDQDKMSITCYDQMRYLKNKDTYNFINMTATEIIKQIAGDFNLRVGQLTDTKWKIASLPEKDKTLFDMITDALNDTLVNTGELYVFYDNFGNLTLKGLGELKVGVLIDDETAQSFNYSSSIDDNTYNNIKLYYENSQTGIRDVYIANDNENIKQWGVLQYYESLNEGENGKEKADKLLKLYNAKTKRLTVSGAWGDCNVLAGRLIPVTLEIGEFTIDNFMLVEKCTHHFKDNEHTMDLTLRGGEFNG